MLQRVRRDQVRLGMFIHGFEGSWLEHPFWRRRFVISDASELQAVRASGVETVLIDVSKGLAPEAPDAGPMTAASPSPRPSAAERPCSPAQEFARAADIVGRSKRAVEQLFAQARLGKAIEAARLAPLVEEISGSVARNRAALISITRLGTKDEQTYLHSVAVSALMINLARHMKLDETLARDLGMAGLLHDIGKMALPAALLGKPGLLSASERVAMQAHAEHGHKLLTNAGGVPQIALDVCRHHHERIDGSGYPQGLKGKQISLFARMAAVCDVYDTATSRSYGRAATPSEAMAEMIEARGQLDAAVTASFIQSVGIYPVGTLVRLSSDRLAVVIDDRPADPTRPLVRAFYAIRERRKMPSVDVPLSRSGHGERILTQEDPARWALADWSTLCPKLIAGAA